MNAKDILVLNWMSNTLARFGKDRSQDYVYLDEMRKTADPLDHGLTNYRPNLARCLFL